jgi:arginyl-tRNA synthetase
MVEFSEVLDYEKIDCLENEDKEELVRISQTDSDEFWDWLEEKYPDKKKITIDEINLEIDLFINENSVLDNWDFKRYFWKNSRYHKRRIRV